MISLPLLIDEEMNADWRKVRAVRAPSDAATFGTPGFDGFQVTGGSLSTPGFYKELRLVGRKRAR